MTFAAMDDVGAVRGCHLRREVSKPHALFCTRFVVSAWKQFQVSTPTISSTSMSSSVLNHLHAAGFSTPYPIKQSMEFDTASVSA